jgi:phosphatidate cytidylyltransferase
MLKRTITSLLLLVIGFPAIAFGGVLYFLLMGFLLGAAAWEYVGMFQAVELRPARLVVVGGVLVIAIARSSVAHLLFPTIFPAASIPIFTLFILLAMSIHLVGYERGRDQAALDFAISLSGLTYIGWVGSYLFDLRALPNGGWWFMFVLPIVWLVDTGAYVIGSQYGKHKMTPRLSPKKSWEGFWAGAFTGVLSGAFFAYVYSTWGPHLYISTWQGALFGLAIGLLTPLGDLGESMLKRLSGMKDSGNIIPGHGGAFDRIDSWLWAAVLGYYFITWFVG